MDRRWPAPRFRHSATPLASLAAVALAGGTFAGCTLSTDPAVATPRAAVATGIGDSATSALWLRRTLAMLAWRVDRGEPAGTLTAMVDGERVEYRALVIEGELIPSRDPARRATAPCPWSPTTLFAWRGSPVSDGFLVIGESFAAEVSARRLFVCPSPVPSADAEPRPIAPHVYHVGADVASAARLGVAGSVLLLREGASGAACAPGWSQWGWTSEVPCAEARYTVRAAVRLRTAAASDTALIPTGAVTGPAHTLYVVGGSVPGKRLTLRCDDPWPSDVVIDRHCGTPAGR